MKDKLVPTKPTKSLQSGSEPYSSRVSTMLMWPSLAAMCNEVLSTFVRASREMPALRRISHTSRWLLRAARCNGLVPSQSAVKRAPRFSKALVSSTFPSAAAFNNCFPNSFTETVGAMRRPPQSIGISSAPSTAPKLPDRIYFVPILCLGSSSASGNFNMV
jgi:hypothetical protein